MLTLHTKIEQAESFSDQLVLSCDLHEKSRQRASLISGEEVAVFTVRGTVLHGGDLLIIHKTDLVPYVGADLGVMAADAKRMRGERPFVFPIYVPGRGFKQ